MKACMQFLNWLKHSENNEFWTNEIKKWRRGNSAFICSFPCLKLLVLYGETVGGTWDYDGGIWKLLKSFWVNDLKNLRELLKTLEGLKKA